MSVKFDGTNVKRGSSTVGNLKSGDILREGNSSGGKALCNIKDGKYIREGNSSGGRQIIKIQDPK